MIYFIQAGPRRAGGPIKIGFASSIGDCERRRLHLQVGNARELFLLAVMGGGYDREAELHRRFREGHIRGEWFGAETVGLQDLIRLAMQEEALIDVGAVYCEQCGIRIVQPPRRKLCSAECEQQKKIATARKWKKRRVLGNGDIPVVEDIDARLESVLLQVIPND
jgi:hypothetical protein